MDELAARASAWGGTRLILETSSAWTDVIAFFTRCGFRIAHESIGGFGRDTWFERLIG